MSKQFTVTKEDTITAKVFDKKGNILGGITKRGFNSALEIVAEVTKLLGEDVISKIQYINVDNKDRNLQDDYLTTGKRKSY